MSNVAFIKNFGRSLRVLLLFRFTRYSKKLRSLGVVLKKSIIELFLLVFYVGIGVVIFGNFMYYAENNSDNPNTQYTSIPSSFWCLI